MDTPIELIGGEQITMTPLAARARDVVEREWQARVVCALKRAGYAAESETPVPHGRCDITFSNHAIEVDWAHKWAECIGQALYYGLCLKSRSVCLLLLEHPDDSRFVDAIKRVADNNTPPLVVWTLDIASKSLDMGDGRRIGV